MLLYPTKKQRELILENTPGEESELRSRWNSFIKNEELVRLSPFLHMHARGDWVMLYNTRNLRKIIGGKKLVLLLDELKKPNTFNYQYARYCATLVGKPDRIVNELLRAGFIQKIEPSKDHLMQSRQSRAVSAQTLFLSLQSDAGTHCEYHFPFPGPAEPMTTDSSTIRGALNIFMRAQSREGGDAAIVVSAGGTGQDRGTLKDALEAIAILRTRRIFEHRQVMLTLLLGAQSVDASLGEMLKTHEPQVFLHFERAREDSGIESEKSLWNRNAERYMGLKKLVPVVIPVIVIDHRMRDTIFDRFTSLAERCSVEYVKLQFSRRAAGKRETHDAEYMAELYMSIFRHMRDLGIKETNTGHRIWAFTNEIPLMAKCFLFNRQFSVGPGGLIGRCPHLAAEGIERAGTLGDEYVVKKVTDLFTGEEARSLLPVNREECQSCTALGLCGGGCAFGSYLDTGSHGERDIFHCRFMKKLVGALLDEMITYITGASEMEE